MRNSSDIYNINETRTFLIDSGNRKSAPPCKRKPQLCSKLDRSSRTGMVGYNGLSMENFNGKIDVVEFLRFLI